MSHIERINTGIREHIDFERCACSEKDCQRVSIDGKVIDRRDVEHAMKMLFGQAPPGTRWFTGAARRKPEATS